jgi:hypothetical protein
LIYKSEAAESMFGMIMHFLVVTSLLLQTMTHNASYVFLQISLICYKIEAHE